MARHSKFTWYLVVTTTIVVVWLIGAIGFQNPDEPFQRFGDIAHGEYLSVFYALIPVVAWLVWGRATVTAWGGSRSAIGRAVFMLGVGLTFWAMGAVVWFYYDSCNMWLGPFNCGTEPKDPYPSLADALFLALVPAALVVVANLTRVLALSKRHLVQFLALFALASLVSGYWGLPSTTILGLQYGHD